MKAIGIVLSAGAALAVLPAPMTAAGWVPVSCDERAAEVAEIRKGAGRDPDFRAAWGRYEQELRAAKPGDPKYVPHPYPRSARQVFENFRHAFLTRFVVDLDNPEPRHRKTVRAVRSGDLRYEVVRVENWQSSRCGSHHPAPFYHLVRLYDGKGREFARSALHANGVIAIHANLDGRQGPLDDLTKIAATVRQRFGVTTQPIDAQYVFVSGLPWPCSPVMPCVAFRSGGKTYLVNHDAFLFSIEPDAPRLGVLELKLRPVDPQALSVNAGRAATPWITVGYGFQEGRLVAIGPGGVPLD